MLFQCSDLIAYLKEQLDSKEKELFVIVNKEVEEKQLWMHQYSAQNSREASQQSYPALPYCDTSADSVSSHTYSYSNRDAQCLKLNDVRNNVIGTDNHT